METMISLQHVTRCFETVKVLSDVSFTVEKGSFHALIGEDQSGKTTLLHILMGLDFGYEGTVTVAGHPGKALPPGVRSRIRFAPNNHLANVIVFIGMVTFVEGNIGTLSIDAVRCDFGRVFFI